MIRRRLRLRSRLALVRALGVVLPCALAGCPEGVARPAPGPDAELCERVEDCNDGRACGALRSCVDRVCAAEASLFVACAAPGR